MVAVPEGVGRYELALVTLISNEASAPPEADGCLVLRPYEAFVLHLRASG